MRLIAVTGVFWALVAECTPMWGEDRVVDRVGSREASYFCKRATWAETMVASRAALTALRMAARIEASVWYTTGPMAAATTERAADDLAIGADAPGDMKGPVQ